MKGGGVCGIISLLIRSDGGRSGPQLFFSAARKSELSSADNNVECPATKRYLIECHTVAMGTKRGREGRGPAQEAKKKAKVQAQSDAADSDPASPKVFGVDDLNWKSVQLPDRMDDLGGFFGLEEIDGVDIVRKETPGDIKFKVNTTPVLEEDLE